ncbi:hypothetical protein C8J29_11065 [Cereibacter johrii]|uniref:FCD domain-containing protein n=1 Tax=Cereibacter johrii TaxID=445629 RepID=A0ABX5J3Y8_9RHOB|nr:hypothetical protein C8J29_11065 [Cereibacter johrii]
MQWRGAAEGDHRMVRQILAALDGMHPGRADPDAARVAMAAHLSRSHERYRGQGGTS